MQQLTDKDGGAGRWARAACKAAGACLAALGAPPARAAEPFVTDLAAIPANAVLVAGAIAVVGGAASTLAKLASSAPPQRSWTIMVASDMVSSLVAGLGTFFFCAWREWPPLLTAVCVLVSGFGGSRILDRCVTAALSYIDRLGAAQAERK